jgi:hypothetical protein
MAKSKSENISSNKVSKRKTVYYDADDPNIRGLKAGITEARLGAEMKIVNDASLSVGGQFSNLRFSGGPNKIPFSENPNPKSSTFTKPGSITNLSADWDYSNDSLIITFDFDFSESQNDYVDEFQYQLYVSGGTEKTTLLRSIVLDKTQLQQTVTFTKEDHEYYLGFFRRSFSLLEIAAYDIYGNLGELATLDDIPEYIVDLCTPEITVTSIPMGYSVETVEVCAKPYQFLSVEEVVSDSGTAPTTGYQQIYLSSIKPATILTPTTESRWVRSRYTNNVGLYGEYSNSVKVTPTNPIAVDLTPPNEVVTVSGAWSGDNIVINYTLPETDPGVRFQIVLVAPNASVGYFYVFPTGTSLNQTSIITKADLFTQFGAYYSSFTGVLRSADSSDNKSPGVAFSIAARANPLVGIVPTFTITPLVNGYSVSFDKPAFASYAEVYQKYTPWVPASSQIDSFTGTYSSGGASGTNTVTISSVVDNEGASVIAIPTGYRVIGEGIAPNTYITSVSGNEITVNSDFISQVSGSITGYGVVYSGSSPANIPSTLYQDTYILIRYYDDFGNGSDYSAEQDVVPFSPTTVDITGPGNVSEVGLAANSGIDTSGTLGFNGYIDLSWSAVTESTLRGYRIRFTTDTIDPVYSYVDYPIDQTDIPSGTLTYRLAGLALGATYYVGIATYDQFNNLSTAFIEFDEITILGTPAITDIIKAGNFEFGQGVDANNITSTGSGTKRGLFFDASNYWFLNSSDSARLKVGGTANNYVLWDGASFEIDGNITARGGSFSGNIALTTIGASIYNGDVTTNPGNLTGDGFIFNRDGLLIRKGTSQISLDTANGAITANNGNIADWVISTSKIEKLDSVSNKYAGLSSTGLYKFWSGSNVAGGDTTQFAVDRTGRVFASNVQISGGGIDIGAPPSSLNSGFHVLSDGTMYATGAQINGAITATSGSIQGNFQVVSGSFYTGTSPTSNSVIINDKGLASIGTGNVTLTAILNTPITSGNIPQGDNPSVGTLPSSISFFTKAALIGGWVIDSNFIRDRSDQFRLYSGDPSNNSVSKYLQLFGTDGGTNYAVTLKTNSVNFLEAGTRDVNNDIPNPTVSISRTGVLSATGAIINGNIEATTMNSTGTFNFASGILKGTTSTVDFDLSAGNNLKFLNMPPSDDDGWAGDPTVTIRDSDSKIVKGRRLIYYSAVSGNTTPPNPALIDGSYQLFAGGEFRTVKPGDLLLVQEP